MRTTTLLLLALGLLVLPGCYYDNEEELYPNNFCDTTIVTFANTINPIIQAKCATPGCHVQGGQGAGVGIFTTYNAIMPQVNNGKLLRSITRDPAGTPMPPSGSLSACEIDKIKLWIAAGAANN